MSQPPTPYTRAFDFTDFSAMQPTAQQPGQKIDQELNLSLASTNATISRLNEIQRDDGKLRTSALDLTELTTIAVPPGGSTGQVLAKTSNVSYATAWSTLGTMSAASAANYSTTAVANGLYYPLSGNPSGFLTSVPVTSVAGRTGAIVLTNADISGLGTMATQTAANYAPLASPAFTGNPTSVTPATNDNDTSIATTAFVKAQSYLTSSALTPYALLSGATFTGQVNCSLSLILPQDDANPVSVLRGQIWHDGTGIFRVGTDDGTQQVLITDNSLSNTLASFAPKASPAFTGNPTAPTATFGDDDTSIATTAFVQAGLLGGTAVARNLEVYVRNQSGASIPAGSIVYISGATGNRPLITLSQANNDANSAQTMGFTKTVIANNAFGYVIIRGEVENLDTSALTEGDQLYLSPTVAGAYTTTKPVAPQHLVYVGIVIRAHPTLGAILVAVQNGYELGEIHDVLLTTPANNNLLAYESSTDLWKNKSASTLGIAPLASPAFTGTPSLPTGTTGVTQTAGNNTTALATTAFVSAATPSASTTVSGLVELATNTEAFLQSSSTVALTPSTLPWAISNGNIQRLDFINNTAISGSGGVTTSTAGYRQIFLSSALTVGRASFSAGVIGSITVAPGLDNFRQINFSKKMWLCGKFAANHASTTAGDANNIFSISLGGYTTGMTGDMVVKGIGLKKLGGASSVVQLVVHNGSSQATVSTTKAIATAEVVEYMIYSDGTGNVTLYINGTQEATSSAGPTGATADSQGVYREQVEQTITAATRLVANCYSGQLIIER